MWLRRAVLPVLVLVALSCAIAPRSRQPPGLAVIGVFDSSWPHAGTVRQAGIPIHVARPGGVAGCGGTLDSSRTDTAGSFRLTVPAGAPADWRICTAAWSGGPVVYPMFQFGGAITDSIRVYCRAHGPTGSPQCLEVPVGEPLHWPGAPE
jgi:hypothetical protein